MNGRTQQRVLMLLENSPYSEDGRVRREASALRDAGHLVTVICPRAAGEGRSMEFDGVRAYQYTQRALGSGFLGYVVEYGYAMAATLLLSIYVFFRHGFDVIHAHNPPDFFVAIACLFKPFGKRFIYDHHDSSPELYRARFEGDCNRLVYSTLLFFERLSCRLADEVIATNESHKRLEIERAGADHERITIVRNGPEPMHFRQVEPHPSLQGCEETIIGYVGQMGKQDGVDYLIRALGHLHRDRCRKDWQCVLVGNGEACDRLHAMAQELGIADRVRFTGRVSFSDVVPYLAGMHICTVPDPWNSYNDRCTMVKVMEYMAQAKPTVAFDLAETRYSAGGAAIYVKPNDERAFAQALNTLIDDHELRAQLGAIARRRAETELAWSHFIPKLLSVYERLGRSAETEAISLRPLPAQEQPLAP
ncbi:MAG: glycosyltransferase family 4 protein [Pirellulales bacterium]